MGRYLLHPPPILSLNVKRRNLSVAQRAMAAAAVYDLEKDAGSTLDPGEKWYQVYSERFGVGKNAIKQARALLERDPIAAEAVKNGPSTGSGQLDHQASS